MAGIARSDVRGKGVLRSGHITVDQGRGACRSRIAGEVGISLQLSPHYGFLMDKVGVEWRIMLASSAELGQLSREGERPCLR